ncbi:MAG: YbgC/FadM family acyl-CoA thioesterase [Alphaproteobacteria bacterium]|jgi:acyl-CoA thioester hydrolase|nr:YbgC/FadM family acyl-CoA thioesterase [Alphaproteobacteria bacterium]
MTTASEPALGGVLDGGVHRMTVRVYYEDTDFTGLVYHASYVRFFERGRTEFLRALDLGHAALLARPDPCAFAVTRLDVRFLKAARIDDLVVVTTAWRAFKGARMQIGQRIDRAGEPIAEAEVEAVCIDARGAARRPPADLVARLRPFLA